MLRDIWIITFRLRFPQDSMKYEIRFQVYHFRASFASQGVLNKDPTVLLNGARPANTCIPPSFPGNAPAHPNRVPNPKSTLASMLKLKVLNHKSTLYDSSLYKLSLLF
jgi:hypothetical protein